MEAVVFVVWCYAEISGVFITTFQRCCFIKLF